MPELFKLPFQFQWETYDIEHELFQDNTIMKWFVRFVWSWVKIGFQFFFVQSENMTGDFCAFKADPQPYLQYFSFNPHYTPLNPHMFCYIPIVSPEYLIAVGKHVNTLHNKSTQMLKTTMNVDHRCLMIHHFQIIFPRERTDFHVFDLPKESDIPISQ